VKQKRSGSSFVGGYSAGIPAYFDFSRLIVIDTQILHWSGFDAHVLLHALGQMHFGGKLLYPALLKPGYE